MNTEEPVTLEDRIWDFILDTSTKSGLILVGGIVLIGTVVVVAVQIGRWLS